MSLKKLGLLSLLTLSASLTVVTRASALIIFPVDAQGHPLDRGIPQLIRSLQLCGIPVPFNTWIEHLLDFASLLFVVGTGLLHLSLQRKRRSQTQSKQET